jgi:predicted dehydrogenase
MAQALRVGLIGAGAITRHGYLPALKDHPGAEVVAICSGRGGTARQLADEFGIPHVANDFVALLRDHQLDAVTVATPNSLHAEISIAAMTAGAHVLCEKPMATSPADAERMVSVARETGKLLALNHTLRLLPDLQMIKERAEANWFGSVRTVHIRVLRRAGIPGLGSWFTRKDLAGAGVLFDLGSHLLDLALWMLGKPQIASVSAQMEALHGPKGLGVGSWGTPGEGGRFDVDDYAALTLKTAAGQQIHLEASWAYFGPDEFRVQLIGENGGVDCWPERGGTPERLTFYRYDGLTPATENPALPPAAPPEAFLEPGWRTSMTDFVEACLSGRAPMAPGEDGIETCRLLDLALRSAERRSEVDARRAS